MPARLLVALLVVAGFSCRRAPRASSLREPARAILEKRCGDCHRADSPQAAPRALAVFTLNEIDFTARMSDAQFGIMLDRLDEGHLPADELGLLKAFVAEERRRRAPASRR